MTENPAPLPRSDRLARFFASDLWWSFRSHPMAMAAAFLLVFLIVAAFAAPLYVPQNPFDPAELQLINAEIPPIWLEGGQWPWTLGTDTQGGDILSAILYGSRISIMIGLASVVLSLIVGIGLGLMAGYYGGIIDNALMRVGDILLSISTILIAILGSLRIVDAPRDAQVFVDGYYAGSVDDYDGVFQRLNLEPGGHRIEIDVYPGVPPMDFEVYVEPGRTVTIHARP